jgi:thiamine biosynthesis lipoprotein
MLTLFWGGYSLKAQIRLEGNAQGTTYHISYEDSLSRNLQYEIDSLLEAFDLSVSTYRQNSVISRINRNEKVLTDAWFTKCFQVAKDVYEATDGAFDPTVFPLVNAWGWGPGKKQSIRQSLIDSLLPLVGFNKMHVKGRRVIKERKESGLDFNAFAQGYSADVVADFLHSRGIRNAVVEIGGETVCRGQSPNGKPFLVAIEKPIDNPQEKNPPMMYVSVENAGVATSGNYRKYFVENGIKYAHHIDPKTGYPAKNNLLSATVISKQCIRSDAYATGLLVMGLEKSIHFLDAHPHLQAMLVYCDENGNYGIYKTKEFPEAKP